MNPGAEVSAFGHECDWFRTQIDGPIAVAYSPAHTDAHLAPATGKSEGTIDPEREPTVPLSKAGPEAPIEGPRAGSHLATAPPSRTSARAPLGAPAVTDVGATSHAVETTKGAEAPFSMRRYS